MDLLHFDAYSWRGTTNTRAGVEPRPGGESVAPDLKLWEEPVCLASYPQRANFLRLILQAVRVKERRSPTHKFHKPL